MKLRKTEDLGVNLEDLKVEIEKYPMAESPRLLENFLIIGYEDIYFQEVILKNIQQANNNPENEKPEIKRKGSDTKIYFREYKPRNLPTILGSISSDFSEGIFDGNQIIEKVFPIPPQVYYGFWEAPSQDVLSQTNVVFTNIQNNVVNIGYAYIFYENKINNKYKICMPKAFVIISQYPFFNIFNTLCKEIKKLYSIDQLQIPIEIQLFNIVNFVPAPVNSSMKMTLIPGEELFEINKCKDKEDFINSKKQETYKLDQLSGYRCSDINFSELFSVLSVETIVEVYLELISGKIIGFFSKYIEILNLTMYIFQQFIFPLSPNENVSGLSPTKFFCSENIDQYIVGFISGYDELENVNPFREVKNGEFRFLSEEEEKKGLDPLLFKCDYILDLDKKILKEQDKYSYGTEVEDNKQNERLSDFFRRVINSNSNSNSYLENYITRLLTKLKEISYKLTSYQHNSSKLPNFFEFNDSNEILNRAILESFYQFNLNISFFYYYRVSTYNGDYKISKEDQDVTIKPREETGLSEDEYLFFQCFSNSLYCNVLGNFIGGYSPKEPKIYKTPKRIFEKLISSKKIFLNSKDEYFEHILDIYDSVYIKKENVEDIDEENSDKNPKKNDKNSKKDDKKGKNKNEIINQENLEVAEKKDKYKTIITFLEFYKYYFSSPKIASYFYSIVNPDFVIRNLNKNNKKNIKYTYKYKKIDIDKNLIFQYVYLIKEMDENTKKRLFKLTDDDIQMKQIISSSLISTAIEKYYINCKLIDYKELIKFSVLGIVALSASKHKLVHFTTPIYQIIGSLKFSVRKFVEIILSISLRLFSNEVDKNLFIYDKYFKLYNEGIEKRQLFPNDELIILEKKINEFTKKIENTREDMVQEDYKKLMETKEKSRYTLDYDKKKASEIKAPSYSFGLNEIRVKINFKTKKKKFYSENCYSFITIYEKITSILNEYYNDLDYSKIDKNEYNKLIIFLMYFTTILNEEFPKEITLFLFYCLELDYL
jgi:hypothetical protein